MFGKGLLKGLGITLKHAWEPDMTIQYPEEMPFLEERFRGRLAYIYSRCIACNLCVIACPNRVLSFETAVQDGTKKKKVLSYTIDLQYCLYCNLCVEICPTTTLYFSHDFELAKYNRDEIKIVYYRPPELDLVPEKPAADGSGATGQPLDSAPTPNMQAEPPGAELDAKRLKQVEAMKTVLGKNPHKALAKILEGEADIDILAGLIAADGKKLTKLAELMIDDKDKAQKLATALVNKAKKDASAEGGEPA
ncbi:MAG: NADH-quinone oxidoreductase subunit I [Firmicutes bacterium]|nr:NADH-quinone oxidoreductase subunit I [Bacillota bacterium]